MRIRDNNIGRNADHSRVGIARRIGKSWSKTGSGHAGHHLVSC